MVSRISSLMSKNRVKVSPDSRNHKPDRTLRPPVNAFRIFHIEPLSFPLLSDYGHSQVSIRCILCAIYAKRL
jgi:hypothetical protein